MNDWQVKDEDEDVGEAVDSSGVRFIVVDHPDKLRDKSEMKKIRQHVMQDYLRKERTKPPTKDSRVSGVKSDKDKLVPMYDKAAAIDQTSVLGPRRDDRDSSAETSTISEATARSLKTFDSLLQAGQSDDANGPLHAQISDNLARFRIWADNIGAFHPRADKRSPDYGLRDAPSATIRLLELLEELADSHDDLLTILRGDRPDRSLVPENGLADEEELALLGFNEPLSEAHEICLSVGDTITSLLKVSALARKSIPSDRYARAASATHLSFYLESETQHVTDKFPKLRESPRLAKRLGWATTQRRQFLRYSKYYHGRSGKPKAMSKLVVPGSPKERETRLRDEMTSTLQAAHLTPEQFSDPISEDDDDNYSQATPSASFKGAEQGQDSLQMISLHDLTRDDAPFQCPFCCGIVRFERNEAWQKHVLLDLRAYVCTFESCKAGLFESREAWFRHELEVHRREWTCNSCLDLDTIFVSASDMEGHLRGTHGQTSFESDPDLLMSILNASSRPVSEVPAASACPLCDHLEVNQVAREQPDQLSHALPTVSVAELKTHLAAHLESLALFATKPNSHMAAVTGNRGELNKAAFESDDAAPLQYAPYAVHGMPSPAYDSEARDDASYVPTWKQEVRAPRPDGSMDDEDVAEHTDSPADEATAFHQSSLPSSQQASHSQATGQKRPRGPTVDNIEVDYIGRMQTYKNYKPEDMNRVPPLQAHEKGDKVWMVVTEGGMSRARRYTVAKAEYRDERAEYRDGRWYYQLMQDNGSLHGGGATFAEDRLRLYR